MTFDLFGRAAAARAKALEEALQHERQRNDDLTKQILAMSDARAFRVVNPIPREQRATLEAKPNFRAPTDFDGVTTAVQKLKAHLSESKPAS